jgi:outer membrane protein assembly factor BamB
MKKTGTLSALALLLCACSGDKVISENETIRPADLVTFEATVPVKLAWSAQLNIDAKRRGFSLVPVEYEGQIFTTESNGRVACYDAARGTFRWDVKLDARLSSGAGVGNGLLVVGSEDGELFELDTQRGDIKWRTPLSSEILAAPQVAADKVLVSIGDGKVVALDARTGQRIWVSSNTVPALSLRGGGRPVVVGERVIVGFASGHLAAFNLHNGKRLWETAVAVSRGRSEIERLIDIDSTPRVFDNMIYTVTYQGQIAALTLDSGQIVWSREASSYADIAIDDSHVYYSDNNGELWALDRTSGATLWRQDKLHGRATTAPALLGDYVAVGDFQGYIHWMTRADGRFVARVRMDDADRRAVVSGKVNFDEETPIFSVPGGIRLAPWAANQKLYVRDENGVLAAFRTGS